MLQPQTAQRLASIGLLLAITLAIPAHLAADDSVGSDNFLYPIGNPYLATIIGTPPALAVQHGRTLKLKERRLPRRTDRSVPRVLWWADRLHYSFAAQSGPAPLIFTVAGTGGYHNTGTNRVLMEAFYNAGYHVVGLTSPSHPEFIAASSSTGVTGHMRNDAIDLHTAMLQISAQLDARIQISGYALAGYSLGGTHAAFIANLDEQRAAGGQPSFDFQRVLLLNPAVSLYNSISKLDRMLSNIPGGVDNFDRFFNDVVRRIGGAYTRSTSIEFGTDLVFEAFKDARPTDEELAAVIGVAFRLAAANLIFTADVMTDFGFIKPSQQELARNTRITDYLQVALRLGFTDYFHDFFWPFYADTFDGDRQAFAASQSLVFLEEYLARAEHVAVVHNQDDVILVPGEIEFLQRTFGQRALIFPRGGHLGNLAFQQTQAAYLEFLNP